MLESDHSSNEDRLEYLYLNLVGQLVQVHTIDGAIAEGIFCSRTDPETAEDEAGVFIVGARFLRSELHKPLVAAGFTGGTQLFYYKDIVMLEAVHMKIRTETPGAGNVYSYRGEHDLKTLDWADEGNEELLEEGRNTGEWDQFEANKRFGVRSTYDETIYTTKLDKSKMTKEQLDYADRMAREIERSSTRGIQHAAEREEVAGDDVDEGAMFSDVARTNNKREKFGAGQQQQQQQQQTAVPGRKESGKGTANNTTIAGKRVSATEEDTTLPLEGAHGRDFNPNPAAPPFVPFRPIIDDYLRALAEAIKNNPACYHSEPDWPGEDDHYDKDDSSYTLLQQSNAMQHGPFAAGPMGPPPSHPPPQQQQPNYGGVAPNTGAFAHGGHSVMQHQAMGRGMGYQGHMMGSYNHHAHSHMVQQGHMDPTQMGGVGPSPQQQQQQQQQQQRMSGGAPLQHQAPMPPQHQQRASSAKTSQPQQPVVGSLPMHLQQQQAPSQQPQQTVAPVDSTAPQDKAAPQKKLSRGMKPNQSRAEASGDGAAATGKRGGK